MPINKRTEPTTMKIDGHVAPIAPTQMTNPPSPIQVNAPKPKRKRVYWTTDQMKDLIRLELENRDEENKFQLVADALNKKYLLTRTRKLCQKKFNTLKEDQFVIRQEHRAASINPSPKRAKHQIASIKPPSEKKRVFWTTDQMKDLIRLEYENRDKEDTFDLVAKALNEIHQTLHSAGSCRSKYYYIKNSPPPELKEQLERYPGLPIRRSRHL
jgi:hypothetical protein